MRAGAIAGAVLVAVYVATLAPGVTWWDAGEFISAAHVWGIPHPPGVPLYVTVANSFTKIMPWFGSAIAVNFLSALSAATACAIGAAMVTRFTGSAVAGIAGALCAGGAATVWMNATEAEVYAPALLLGVATIYSGSRSSEESGCRWLMFTSYLMGLGAALHLTALVAAPAAIAFASIGRSRTDAIRRTSVLGASLVLSAGIGSASVPLMVAGVCLMFLHAVLFRRSRERSAALYATALVILASTALLILPLRALWDPALNQGNPVHLQAFIDVLSRSQYDVAPILPRQAPLWLQFANYFQYLDWQFGLGFAPTVLPSVLRTLACIVFLVLAWQGYDALRGNGTGVRRAWLLLLLSTSAGVVLYLNLKAGPSIGVGILPDDTPHEARDRDYFFILSFWSIALLAGAGAVVISRRWSSRGAVFGLVLASLPLIVNFRAVDRSRGADAELPSRWSSALLESLPEGAVLFVAGDNDTYPLWYQQNANSLRQDVLVVTIPLLGARWYREELARRHDLLRGPSQWRGLAGTVREIRDNAVELKRPVTVAVSVVARDRLMIDSGWAFAGLHFRLRSGWMPQSGAGAGLSIDAPSIGRAAAFARAVDFAHVRPGLDRVDERFSQFLSCPDLALQWLWDGMSDAGRQLLDSRCNFR